MVKKVDIDEAFEVMRVWVSRQTIAADRVVKAAECVAEYLGSTRLSEAASQPPAPITTEDVRAAERAWRGRCADEEHRNRGEWLADYLNRRTETKGN